MVLKGLSQKLKSGLAKTRHLFAGIKGLFRLGRRVDQEFLDELEALLIQADIGWDVTQRIINDLQEDYRNKEVTQDLLSHVKGLIREALTERDNQVRTNPA